MRLTKKHMKIEIKILIAIVAILALLYAMHGDQQALNAGLIH